VLAMTRREALGTTGLAFLSSIGVTLREVLGEQTPGQASGKLIGVQVGAVSFVDEGVDQVLDTLQERALVNTIFLAVFSYGRGIAGRQIPGQPLPDHGKQEYDTDTFYGGNYATPHADFYRMTVLKETKAPDHGDLDILELVLPAAKKRGLRVYAWAEDVWRTDVPHVEKVQEWDLYGRRRPTLCFRNPDYLFFLEGLMQDYATNYPIDGIMWGSERQGPLWSALGALHGRPEDPGRVGCFCSFCRQEAQRRGISVTRALEGFATLEGWVRAAQLGERPTDGYFVEFWRILWKYPEILAWHKLWTDGQHNTYRRISRAAKVARRDLPVGFHLWHLNSFSPFWRAEQDYAELARVADFLKIVVYHNCGGPRLASYVRNIRRTLFRDLKVEEVLRLHYAWLNYDEASLEELSRRGLSPDYVYREISRARAGVRGRTAIYAGIDVDIPTGKDEKKTAPQDVREAVEAAFRAEADGIILSRKYSEMRLANLSAAGDAVRALRLPTVD
jgi:hypothetical protein